MSPSCHGTAARTNVYSFVFSALGVRLRAIKTLSSVWAWQLQLASWKHEYNAWTSSLLCNLCIQHWRVSCSETSISKLCSRLVAQFQNRVRNLEIGKQFGNWQNAQYNFEIVQIAKKRGTYMYVCRFGLWILHGTLWWSFLNPTLQLIPKFYLKFSNPKFLLWLFTFLMAFGHFKFFNLSPPASKLILTSSVLIVYFVSSSTLGTPPRTKKEKPPV